MIQKLRMYTDSNNCPYAKLLEIYNTIIHNIPVRFVSNKIFFKRCNNNFWEFIFYLQSVRILLGSL